MMFHNEPIIRDSKVVSYITSANYGHFLKGAIGLGYVPCEGEGIESVLSSKYEIEIAGERIEAIVNSKPMYDPSSKRTKM